MLFVNAVPFALGMSLVSSNIHGFTKKATAAVRNIYFLYYSPVKDINLVHDVPGLLFRTILWPVLIQAIRSPKISNRFQRFLLRSIVYDPHRANSSVCVSFPFNLDKSLSEVYITVYRPYILIQCQCLDLLRKPQARSSRRCPSRRTALFLRAT